MIQLSKPTHPTVPARLLNFSCRHCNCLARSFGARGAALLAFAPGFSGSLTTACLLSLTGVSETAAAAFRSPKNEKEPFRFSTEFSFSCAAEWENENENSVESC